MTDPMYIKWGRLEAGLGYEKIEVYFGGIRISPGVGFVHIPFFLRRKIRSNNLQ